MIPAPDSVYKCPKCDEFFKNRNLLSGNTCGAILYSDGKQNAPMLPEFPNLTKCEKCDSIFWLSDLKEIGEIDCWGEESNNKEWANAPYAEFLNIKDLFRALDENKDDKKVVYIQLMIWRTFNDRVRQNNNLFIDESEKNLWIENCNSLIKLLDKNDVNEQIMIAELYRNLGQFENCMEIIDSLSNDFDWLKSQFKEECRKQNQLVFCLKR
ncbi:MAG: hypothetical protein LBB53_00410 [Prevotellaceae bacterium]|jgi:uncharacterized C2H2 Zn-finger protein|nr:hypothetical protein [Prevotellaceae bacterium]